MTTSRETEELNFSVLRRLIEEANALSLDDRVTLLKGLIPGIASMLPQQEFNGLVAELRLKGDRYYDAQEHPGQGKMQRHVPGERGIESRS